MSMTCKHTQHLSQQSRRHQQKLTRETSKRVGLMNNSKWQKVFTVLDELNPKGVQLKSLLYPKTANIDVFFMGGFYVESAAGVFCYKEIEWIFIPQKSEQPRFNRQEKLPSFWQENDLLRIETALNELGQFAYQKDDQGLFILGYQS